MRNRRIRLAVTHALRTENTRKARTLTPPEHCRPFCITTLHNTAAGKNAPFIPESGASCQNRCAFTWLATSAGALRQKPSPQVGNAAYPARFIEKL
jgi:hypothetical protein